MNTRPAPKLTDAQMEAKALRQVAAYLWHTTPAQTGLDQYHHDVLIRVATSFDPQNVAEVNVWPEKPTGRSR